MVTQYITRFIELSFFASTYVLNLLDQAQKIEDGLREEI